MSDGLGCSISQSFTVSQPPAVNAVATVEAVSCSLAQDGALMVQVNGGVAPYTYQWNASPAAVQSPGAQFTLRTSGSSAGNTISGNLLLTGDSTGIDGIPAGNYQLVITDNNGCVTTNNYVLVDPPNPCSISISLRLFIEGFYDGNQTMTAVANASAGIADTVTLELHETVAPYGIIQSASSAIDTSGWGEFVFPASLWQQSFYIVIKHRNSLETWSKTPFHLPTGVQQFNLTDSFVPVIGNPFLPRESIFKD
ncbi:MAG: SprB repeat-containing protein [Bacteroidetes bacterium]|nr:SprB repeat-containing protein [Bacteroidota bacterium]